ncbi:MAG: hypothetical protein K2H85_00170 [Allobaculum sp.]|nr:hypothetical protein [Allobaculum sp.]
MKRLSLIITLSVIFVTLISAPLLATDPDNLTLDIPTGWEDETTDSVEQPFWERLLIGNSEDSVPTNIIMVAVSSNEFSPPMSLKMLVSSPSPEASEMIRHQEEEIDHATGTGRLTIPLYTLTSGDLTVPLTLQHRLGGFKADEKGGWIGLGWHLSGGGCVTRRIVGMPDELVPFDITTSTKLGNSSNTDSDIEYLMNLQELKKDASYDRYSYICPGSNGEFIIKDGTIVPLLNNGDVIEFTGNVIDKVRDFTVTTPDGTKYFFTEREHVSQQPILSTLRKLTAPAYAKAVSTWHLTKIQSPGGGEVITYSYSTLSSWNRKTVARSETHTVSVYTEKTLYSGSQLDAYLPSGTITTFLDQKVLSKISSRMGDVTFTNETKKSTVDDTPSRLSKIVVSSKDGVNVREIRLNGEGQLSSCNIYADNVLIDGHTFSYNSGYSQGSTDFLAIATENHQIDI